MYVCACASVRVSRVHVQGGGDIYKLLIYDEQINQGFFYKLIQNVLSESNIPTTIHKKKNK